MLKEACVETLEEALIAQEKGADRIELCSELDKDGLTPSFDLMKAVCDRLKIPVMVMIRPRDGDFCYSEMEIEQMKEAIDQAKEVGAHGVVLGLLTPDKTIDVPNTRLLARYANPLPVTFHKAVDEMADPVKGVVALKSIPEIKRILTSGGKKTAQEGVDVIMQMMKVAGEQIIILVAGRVLATNIDELKQSTNASEFHGRRIVGSLV